MRWQDDKGGNSQCRALRFEMGAAANLPVFLILCVRPKYIVQRPSVEINWQKETSLRMRRCIMFYYHMEIES